MRKKVARNRKPLQNSSLKPFLPDEVKRKSLQILEGDDWGEPPYPSYLVVTCHALRRKPLKDFTTEDLRIMIGQRIGLPYLVPLALERIGDNPLAAGDFYEGDLLHQLLSLDPQFWQERSDLRRLLEDLINLASSLPQVLEKDLKTFQGQ